MVMVIGYHNIFPVGNLILRDSFVFIIIMWSGETIQHSHLWVYCLDCLDELVRTYCIIREIWRVRRHNYKSSFLAVLYSEIFYLIFG